MRSESKEKFDINTVLGYWILIVMFLDSIYNYNNNYNNNYIIAEIVCSISLFIVFHFFIKSKKKMNYKRYKLKVYLVALNIFLGVGFVLFKNYLDNDNLLSYSLSILIVLGLLMHTIYHLFNNITLDNE